VLLTLFKEYHTCRQGFPYFPSVLPWWFLSFGLTFPILFYLFLAAMMLFVMTHLIAEMITLFWSGGGCNVNCVIGLIWSGLRGRWCGLLEEVCMCSTKICHIFEEFWASYGELFWTVMFDIREWVNGMIGLLPGSISSHVYGIKKVNVFEYNDDSIY
jgi:hypothetical protein